MRVPPQTPGPGRGQRAPGCSPPRPFPKLEPRPRPRGPGAKPLVSGRGREGKAAGTPDPGRGRRAAGCPRPAPSRHLTICGSAACGAPPQTPGPSGQAPGIGKGPGRESRRDPETRARLACAGLAPPRPFPQLGPRPRPRGPGAKPLVSGRGGEGKVAGPPGPRPPGRGAAQGRAGVGPGLGWGQDGLSPWVRVSQPRKRLFVPAGRCRSVSFWVLAIAMPSRLCRAL